MKKHRKQSVNVSGRRQLVDVPVDNELYKADNRAEYLRAISKAKHVPLNEIILVGFSADVTEIYEEAELLACLREALQTLSEKERRLIECIYYDGLTEKETATILMIAQQTVNKKKHKIIKKLRICLSDWI